MDGLSVQLIVNTYRDLDTGKNDSFNRSLAHHPQPCIVHQRFGQHA